MKKVLLMCLMCVMCLSQTFADSKFSGGDGTAENPYQISTPEDLVQLSTDVTSKNPYEGKFLKMTNDIDMSSVANFTPIGNNHGESGEGTMFMGTFDGDGHTIYNLNSDFEGKGKYYQGVALFGIVMNATVKNLTIDKSNFIGYGMISPFVAVSFGAKIQNCHSGKDVTVTAEKLGAAGIVGFSMMTKTIIEDCSSKATVIAHFKNGGVAGGIIACVSEGGNGTTVRRCVNYGDVTSDFDQAAGILPFIQFPAVVEDCANFGRIEAKLVGGTGIAYYATRPDDNYLVVKNCYNVAQIIGKEPGNIDAVCLGNVFEGGGENSCKVENCYYASDIEGAVSKTAHPKLQSEMKTQAFVDSLNNGRADGPWCIIEGIANGFPVPLKNTPLGIDNVTVKAPSAVISYNAGIVTATGVKAGEKFFVVDLSGRTLKKVSAQNDGELTIDVTSLPAGTYVVGNSSTCIKIVK